jgi:hypothetical protein
VDLASESPRVEFSPENSRYSRRSSPAEIAGREGGREREREREKTKISRIKFRYLKKRWEISHLIISSEPIYGRRKPAYLSYSLRQNPEVASPARRPPSPPPSPLSLPLSPPPPNHPPDHKETRDVGNRGDGDCFRRAAVTDEETGPAAPPPPPEVPSSRFPLACRPIAARGSIARRR